MAYITKNKLREIIQNAPAGTTPEGIVASLRESGHQLEGYPTQDMGTQREEQRGTLTKIAGFLGIENIGKRIGSELVRLTPEGKMLKDLEAQGGISAEEAKQIRTGGVTNKQAALSAGALALNLGGANVIGRTATRLMGGAGALPATATLGARALRLGKTAAEFGIVGGAQTGLTSAQDEGKTGGEIARDVAIGAGVSAALPIAGAGLRAAYKFGKAGLGGAAHLAGRGVEAANEKIVKTAIVNALDKGDDAAKALINQSDDLTAKAVVNAPAPVRKAVAAAKDVNLDDQVTHLVSTSKADDVAAYKKMTDIAKHRLTPEGVRSSAQPKEVVGKTILDRVGHLLGKSKTYAAELTNTVDDIAKTRGGKGFDVTDIRRDFLGKLEAKGVFWDGEKLVQGVGARIPKSDLAGYEKILEQLPRTSTGGRTIMQPHQIHNLRKQLFEEFGIAKARQQAFSGGLEKDVDAVRSALAAKLGTKYQNLNLKEAKIMGGLKDFVSLTTYKGNLKDLTSKDLRVGEIALRMLGNAADRPTTVINSIDDLARAEGFKGGGTIADQIKFADLLETIYGNTQTRGFAGGVTRGTQQAVADATGAATDVAGGNIPGLLTRAAGFIQGGNKAQQEALEKLIAEMLKHPSAAKAATEASPAAATAAKVAGPKLRSAEARKILGVND